jgi:hypothetical protein
MKKRKVTKAQRLANRAKMQAYRLANPEKVRAARAKYDAKRQRKKKDEAPPPIGIPEPTDHSQDPACIAIRQRFHAFRKALKKHDSAQ